MVLAPGRLATTVVEANGFPYKQTEEVSHSYITSFKLKYISVIGRIVCKAISFPRLTYSFGPSFLVTRTFHTNLSLLEDTVSDNDYRPAGSFSSILDKHHISLFKVGCSDVHFCEVVVGTDNVSATCPRMR